MVASRLLHKTIATVMVAVLLFAQAAVASYACPRLVGGAAAAAAAAALANTMDGMPADCDERGPDSANLCVEHCRFGQQTADTSATALTWHAVPVLLYPVAFAPLPLAVRAPAGPAPHRRWVAALAPPHAILHCVFRI